MKIKELLKEDYNEQLSSDLNNILVGAKASGINDIDPNIIVRQMQKMGYSISVGSLITLLQNNPVVQNASPKGIRVTGDDTSDAITDTENSADQVNAMAQKATQKGLK